MAYVRYYNVPFKDGALGVCYKPNMVIDKEHLITLHWHEHIEFIYFTQGDALVLCGNELLPAHAGDFFIINSNEIHSITPIENKHALYQNLVINEFVMSDINIKLNDFHFQKKVTDDHTISELIRLITSELDDKKTYYINIVSFLIRSLILLIVRSHTVSGDTVSGKNQKSELVKNIIIFLRENYNKTVTLDMLSQHMSYSKDYISHSFTELTGQSVISYLNDYRLRKAKCLISSGDFNITEAFNSCGFSNFSYFTKLYKNKFGASPSKDLPKT